jgi:radical SAM protein with 4Fe4S-binding SPASM domain
VNRAEIDAYDAGRDLSGKPFAAACYAPFASMYFDVHGNVIACCQNTRHVLGNVADEPLADIWRGQRAAALRDALRAYDLSHGCEFCQWQVDEGNLANMFATVFDPLPVDPGPELWPAQLEFALSNVCNLECVMCHGEFSSMIRAHREHLPPLPSRYDDGFFEQIRPFLRHAQRARFFGGEPFLARESYRLWDLMAADAPTVENNVTTNGTQWNDRVEAALVALPFQIGISMDGLTKETLETVRVNASHAVVMENFGRFHAHGLATGRPVSLTYCLMAPNWHEFGDFLRFADDWGCQVFVNTVVFPPHLSLYRLPDEELNAVLASLEQQGHGLEAALGLNARVWATELDRLQNWSRRLAARAQRSEGTDPLYFEVDAYQGPDQGPGEGPGHGAGHGPADPMPPGLRAGPAGSFGREAAERLLAEEVCLDEPSVLVLDADRRAVASDDGRGFMGLAPSDYVGCSFEQVLALLEGRFGPSHHLLEETLVGGWVDRRTAFIRPDGHRTEVRVIVFPNVDPSGGVIGSTTVAVRVAPRQERPQPVSVRLRS